MRNPGDIRVLPADDPKELRLGWCIYEYSGCEVFNLSGFFRDGGRLGDIEVLPGEAPISWLRVGNMVDNGLEISHASLMDGKAVIAPAQSIEVGDVLIVSGLFGWHPATITVVDGDKGEAETEKSVCHLRFGEDDRKCWVCNDHINKACLSPLVAMTLDVGKEQT